MQFHDNDANFHDNYGDVAIAYLHRYQDEPFLLKGPPQQSRGCEGSDNATLQRLSLLSMSNDPPHTTPQPLS
ncbi:hypothetical protein E2C01_073203 [Portunus trituberculatus]|uniref:Uncharacterized protein n=1 Tax=Portunus trituberculatus TaxID=210409 RepID=A0A5B7I9Y5_PORTR|nr:hypothetical protein [Portunus trituberculatus]